ncbi:hypothetical protein IV498_02070 [Paenarthrobacter sp. Z7-10]|uniref:hypothetical protein n=1 Tax=Paenarthrobacter sp. Z7-10 TaxID=2787635 RepID=UPI0022A92D7E|nr:hypothetical protein [Paenarthrobacter sp. Z7-10]MCZ2402002.1 hypothetical protein [Paenarthrobacter sp. Z7-10]
MVLGTLGVVGGGLLSAMTAAGPSYHASWAVAYVVLVVGVAQIILGVAQASLTGGFVRGCIIAWEAVCWNLGSATVLTGTLASVPTLLYAGIILLLAALVLFAVAIRHGRRGILFTVTWVVIIVLLVSMPVGAIIQAVTG